MHCSGFLAPLPSSSSSRPQSPSLALIPEQNAHTYANTKQSCGREKKKGWGGRGFPSHSSWCRVSSSFLCRPVLIRPSVIYAPIFCFLLCESHHQICLLFPIQPCSPLVKKMGGVSLLTPNFVSFDLYIYLSHHCKLYTLPINHPCLVLVWFN